MILIQLFFSFFKVGSFSFGGGLAALPLIQSEVVEGHQWITLTEFTDLITIAEMTPGPIAINAATFVGTQIAGVPGAIVATLGCITPSCLIVSLLAWLYFKYKNLDVMKGALSGLRPAIVALIASAGASIFILSVFGEAGIENGIQEVNVVSIVLFTISLLILRIKKPSPIAVMFGCGLIGALIYSL